VGEAVKLSFILTQSNSPLQRSWRGWRDEYLIKSLIEYLGCGNTSLDSSSREDPLWRSREGRGVIDFKVTNFSLPPSSFAGGGEV